MKSPVNGLKVKIVYYFISKKSLQSYSIDLPPLIVTAVSKMNEDFPIDQLKKQDQLI